jgi:hypothetical protein
MPGIGTDEHLQERLETLWRLHHDPDVDSLIFNGEKIAKPGEPVQRQRMIVALVMSALAQHFAARGYAPELLAPLAWIRTAATEAFKGTRYPLFEPDQPHSRPLEPEIASKTAGAACVLVQACISSGDSVKKAIEKAVRQLNAYSIAPPEAFGRTGREAPAPPRWRTSSLLRLWHDNARLGKMPRASRVKGQKAIRRAFFEAQLRYSESLTPSGVFETALAYLVAEQHSVR